MASAWCDFLKAKAELKMRNKKINVVLVLPIPPNTDLKKYRFRFYRDNKTYSVKARFTFSEYQKLLANIQMPIAVYVRECALKNVVVRRINPPKIDPKLLRQLAQIGNNLNQIARLANQQNQKNDLELINFFAELVAIRQSLDDIKIHFSVRGAAPHDR